VSPLPYSTGRPSQAPAPPSQGWTQEGWVGRRMHPPKPVHTAAVTSIQTSFLSSQQGSQLATASQLPQPLSYLSPAPCGSQSHSHPHSPTEPLLSLLLQAMAAIRFFSWILRSLIQQARMVGEELDEATHECMQQRAEQLSQEMTWLLQEIEQKSQEQSGFAWGVLLFAALPVGLSWSWSLSHLHLSKEILCLRWPNRASDTRRQARPKEGMVSTSHSLELPHLPHHLPTAFLHWVSKTNAH